MHGGRSRHRYPPRLSVSSRRFTLPGTSSSKSVSPPTDSPTPPLLLAIPSTQSSASYSSTSQAPPFSSFPPSSSGVPPYQSAGRRHPIPQDITTPEVEVMDFSWRWTAFAKCGVPLLINKFSEELTLLIPDITTPEVEVMDFSWRWTAFAKCGVPLLINKFSEELTLLIPESQQGLTEEEAPKT
nr:uncharacterized protein LOC117859515 [Setaria viridis]